MSKGPNISVTITTDDRSKGGIDSATKTFDGFGSKVQGVVAGASAAVGMFAIDMGKQLVSAAGEWVNLAKEAEVFNNKANTVFGESSGDIKKWADSVNESFGLSDEAVVGMAASMGDLLKPMGFTEAATADMTKQMLDAAGALSAWSGGKYDAAEVSDIMTKAMLGETDGLKALGISISAAEVDAKLLAKGQDKLTGSALAQAKAIATQELIMEKSTDAQTAWSDGTMDNIKSQNEATAAWEDAKVSLGQGLLPIVQAFTSFLVDSVIPTVRDMVATFQEHWPRIKEVVMGVVQPIMDWFVTNFPIMRDTVNEAMTNIKDVIEAITTVIQAVWKVFGDYILTHLENIFKLVKEVVKAAMDVIKGVIDVVMGLITGDWGRAWDGLKSIITGVWDAIKAVIQYAVDGIKLLLSMAWDGIKFAASTAWEAVKSTITGVWDTIASSIDDIWEGIKTTVSDGIESVIGFIGGIPGGVADAVSGGFDALWDNFKGVINRIIDGINGVKLPGITIGGWDPPGPGPTIPSFTTPSLDPFPHLPRLAEGGIVKRRPGGILANIGEGNWDEAVVPLKPGMGMGGTHYHFNSNTLNPYEVARSNEAYYRDNPWASAS